ncbi:acyl-CoA thioesterase [Cohnella thailandensis]|uniref:Acyl-CoA thioesterase n=1 Tax=Cohnella thailandensis TaxID=557557 RepID=A0A841SUK3_9BACL|nr:acyl-CoA thioesterase [Cohnella thailandensis]MBB6634932.1 acyl-CoA thioesterase [Cohnella thailandensis]MBP1975846.1 acyl-CoA thioester hydrolase [Cohnella thailandensis]
MADTYPLFDLEMMVTWGDCDAAGISYYAKSFDWFTNARMGLLAHYGFPYMPEWHHQGISLVCLHADCQYRKMLRPEERIVVRTELAELTRSRMTFAYRILKEGGALAAEGQTKHAYVDNAGAPFNLERRHPELWARLAEAGLISEKR